MDLADTGLSVSPDLAKVRVSPAPAALAKARNTRVTMSDTGLPGTARTERAGTSPEDMAKIYADPFGERTGPVVYEAQVCKVQAAIQDVHRALDRRMQKRAARFKVGDRLVHRKTGAECVVSEAGPYYYELNLGKGTTSIITLDAAAEYRLAYAY